MAHFTTGFGLKPLTLAAGLFTLAGAATAGEVAAYAGKSIELKDVRGALYYTPKGDAFEVVTTLDSGGHVFRIVSSLKSGQAAVLSVPGAVGEDAPTVEIKREGDRLLVVDRTHQNHAETTVPTNSRND
ncbi:hypothetical protein [Rhodoblastus sp.]|uniref:hypothetical protein n=1 Tax=Rhodoblastus sp. TaxID=1962975 RepID=UPI003F958C42